MSIAKLVTYCRSVLYDDCVSSMLIVQSTIRLFVEVSRELVRVHDPNDNE